MRTGLVLALALAVAFPAHAAEKCPRSRETTGYSGFTLTKIPFNDKKTFEMLGRGDTNGVFQFTDPQATNFPQRFYQARQLP